MDRRGFLKRGGAAGAAITAGGWASVARGSDVTKAPLPAMPTITLGTLEVSRLILGSNPFFGFAHDNPHASPAEMKAYYTKERVMAVLDAAAARGITAVWTPCYDEWITLWQEYRDRGGKLRTWIGQPDRMPMEKEILTAVKNGAKAVCIQGMRIDEQVNAGHWDRVRGWLELIRSHGLPAGMATHGATTHLVAADKGLPADFYNQTLYRPDDYVRSGFDESLATIDKLPKPVIAYKVLGAGRFPPRDALPELLRRLKRKDGVCIGMFPRDEDQIVEDAALVTELTRQARPS
jgi:hypothetical protein